MHVTERRFDIPGGSLTLKLETEHPLDEGEREALERIAADCQRYADRGGPRRRDEAIDTAPDGVGAGGGGGTDRGVASGPSRFRRSARPPVRRRARRGWAGRHLDAST